MCPKYWHKTKVILNLISNSLKFTDSNGKIKVKIFTDYESKKLFVHVQNNGPEISVSDSKKIFSRFIQSDELFTKKIKELELDYSCVNPL